MTKQISQLVALVTYANVSLQRMELDFDLERSISHYCYRLEFIKQLPVGIVGSKVVIASDASNWFAYLKERDAKRVRLHYKSSTHPDLPDHISVAFAGGGSHWFVEVQYEEKSHLYSSELISGTHSSLKKPIVLLERDLDYLEDSSSVSDAREKLGQVLNNLISFAQRFENTQHWAKNFTISRKTLTEFEPQKSDDFIPYDVYSKDARQLIETAFRSWVFGGMGSWIDLAFSGTDQDTYTTLSQELYKAVCNAIVSGVNSYP